MERVANARSAYEKRLKIQKEEEATKKKKAEEDMLLERFELQKKKNSKLNDLETGLADKGKQTKDILTRKESLVKVQEEALRSLKKDDEQLKTLLAEKDKIEERKRTICETLFKKNLKRRMNDDIESPPSKRVNF